MPLRFHAARPNTRRHQHAAGRPRGRYASAIRRRRSRSTGCPATRTGTAPSVPASGSGLSACSWRSQSCVGPWPTEATKRDGGRRATAQTAGSDRRRVGVKSPVDGGSNEKTPPAQSPVGPEGTGTAPKAETAPPPRARPAREAAIASPDCPAAARRTARRSTGGPPEVAGRLPAASGSLANAFWITSRGRRHAGSIDEAGGAPSQDRGDEARRLPLSNARRPVAIS